MFMILLVKTEDMKTSMQATYHLYHVLQFSSKNKIKFNMDFQECQTYPGLQLTKTNNQEGRNGKTNEKFIPPLSVQLVFVPVSLSNYFISYEVLFQLKMRDAVDNFYETTTSNKTFFIKRSAN